ncbi:hypothetical protein DEO72_LG4g318 [Vigna unguiculata]|uniref:Uncharacterized protein n=1 Tax=Vigna unguiculata TaxID=3917 RepID=A0A4D6LMW3_VIGUN|nr:hypothetical protein DEO72_LG4g318 [Vigna unguiculata]
MLSHPIGLSITSINHSSPSRKHKRKTVTGMSWSLKQRRSWSRQPKGWLSWCSQTQSRWLARWWRVVEPMAPFSLAEEENQGLEKDGGPTVAGTGGGSLWQAWHCDREGVWCCLWRRGKRRGPCLACRKKKRREDCLAHRRRNEKGGRFGELGSRRQRLRWWLALTVACLTGHGMCSGNT